MDRQAQKADLDARFAQLQAKKLVFELEMHTMHPDTAALRAKLLARQSEYLAYEYEAWLQQG